MLYVYILCQMVIEGRDTLAFPFSLFFPFSCRQNTLFLKDSRAFIHYAL